MPSTEVVRVHVRNIAVGGAGVGEVISQDDPSGDLLGITAFIPYAALGETVVARIVERKQRYINAELIDVETPSAERRQAECRYFSVCGGCELQHITYGGQLSAKFEMIRSALQAGRLSSETIAALRPVVPSAEFGYRRRVTLHVNASGRVGLYRGGSRFVVAIEECPVAVPAIEELLPRLQSFGVAVRGRISSIILEADEAGVVAVLKAPYDLAPAERQVVLSAARKVFPDVSLVTGDREIGGFGRQILELPIGERGQIIFRVPAGSFSQVNWGINERLIRDVLEVAKVKPGLKALDLFSGAGNFALPLARAGARVVAVECHPRLVVFGRENAVRNGVEKRLEFCEMSVEKFLEGERRESHYDLVVADPPRSGLGPLTGSLRITERLFLISCHLPSFVRDVKALTDHGWTVSLIQPYDMFAQTSYVEILAVFARR